jgi:DNA-binding transcriptional LysR family regulator
MLNWDDLRYAVAAHRAKTMAGAARLLGVKHSTVLRRIEALEEALGTRIFDRTPNGLRETEAGTAVLAAAERVEQGVFEVERTATARDESEDAVVRLATNELFAMHFLGARLAEFRRRRPHAQLMLLTGKAFVSLQQLDAEVAIRMISGQEPPGESNLIARKLERVAWSLYGSRSYLDGRRAPEQISLQGQAPPWLGKPLQDAPISLWTTSLPVTHSFIAGGMGAGVIPCFVGDADDRLERLGPTVGWSTLWLVVHPDLQTTPRVRRVIDFVVEMVKRDGDLLRGERRDRK